MTVLRAGSDATTALAISASEAHNAAVTNDVIVIGAGVAGLALARQLQQQGRNAVVLERARGVGGRCATRRLDAQPVDHGIAYLHGQSAGFLAAVDSVRDASVVENWPLARVGDGSPCRPEAFDGPGRRLAFVEGMSRFPKHLALRTDVRLNANVTTIRLASPASSTADGHWTVTLASGECMTARAVALAIPAPSAIALLRTAAPLPAALADAIPLVGLVRMLPCLTVIARYAVGTPAPAWDAGFPRSTASIQAILHDSSKRGADARLVLVIQARPAYSQANLETSDASWLQALLREAADLEGAWIARPEAVQSHVWRHARVSPGSELARPVAVRLDGGAVLGLTGDGFHEAGGIEGAYLAGHALASRFDELLGPTTKSTREDAHGADR